MVKTEAY